MTEPLYTAHKNSFDDVYSVGYFCMVLTIHEEDDNRKNDYEWGFKNDDGSISVCGNIPGAGSYTPLSEAIEKFHTFLQKPIDNP